ncbi:MAG: 30S ribosomal protein S6 [Nitrospiraceae bacterium]|jgi:small subunit ribosomal protein S6|uniref:Small ribosomal subunit protein bS6 n=1 Tax=Leptospirillum ferrodiazotrophum TaxID=412449 RepID=C6HX90_9BACT|nr:MAG: ribosomal protein S6 [Leptospirillum ferrodiazotrophum]MCL5953505.1 30S ribosomal protein S6 [Nitrospirota bacterium]MDA8149979.1 30S ribosomal protein S6 [Nitrospiraceae bacterium]
MYFYECVLLLKPTLSDEEAQATISRYEKIVEDKGGRLHATQRLGKKRLAYELRKEKKADYVILYAEFKNPADQIELERVARLDERIIKSMNLRRKTLVLPTVESSSESTSGSSGAGEEMAAHDVEGEAI